MQRENHQKRKLCRFQKFPPNFPSTCLYICNNLSHSGSHGGILRTQYNVLKRLRFSLCDKSLKEIV